MSNAEEFRRCAAECDRIADEMKSSGRFADPAKVSPGSALQETERLERMGQLIIDAWEAGFLRDIHGLGKRVEYHRGTGAGDEPSRSRESAGTLARCGVNLLREVVEEVMPAAFPRRFVKTQLTPEFAIRHRSEGFGLTMLKVFEEQEHRTAAAFRFLADKVVAQAPAAVGPAETARAASGGDKKQAARDKWLYKQCCKGRELPYSKVIADLKKIATRKGWEPIENIQGIRAAAHRHARLNGLPRIPNRQDL